MSRGEVQSLDQRIRTIVNRESRDKIRQAFMVTDYIGQTRDVLIQLGDPALGRGAVVRATVKPGSLVADLTAGTPVTVRCRHGHFELVV